MSCSCPISQIALEKLDEEEPLLTVDIAKLESMCPDFKDIIHSTKSVDPFLFPSPPTTPPELTKNHSCPPIIHEDIIQSFYLENNEDYKSQYEPVTDRDYSLNFDIEDEYQKEQEIRSTLLISGYLKQPKVFSKLYDIIPHKIIDITYQYFSQTKQVGGDQIIVNNPEFDEVAEEIIIEEEIDYITSPDTFEASPLASLTNNNSIIQKHSYESSPANTENTFITCSTSGSSPSKQYVSIHNSSNNDMILRHVSHMIRNIEKTSVEIRQAMNPLSSVRINPMPLNVNNNVPGFGGFIPNQQQQQDVNQGRNEFNNNQNQIPPRHNMREFSKMSVEEMIRRNYTIKQLHQFGLIGKFMFDRNGSLFLQDLIEKSNGKLISNIIFDYLVKNYSNITPFCNDKYGHYVIKLLFKYSDQQQKQALVSNLINTHSILALLQNPFGRHVFDTITSTRNNDNVFQLYMILLIDALKNEINQPSKDNALQEILFTPKGSDSLQKVLELRLPFERVSFLANIIESNLLELSIHKIACHFVQKFINIYGDRLNVNKLFNGNDNNDDYLTICNEVHGNYTIQEMLRENKWYSTTNVFIQFRSRFINELFITCSRDRLLSICLNKAGSCVVETCLKAANKKQINAFIQFIKEEHALILDQLLTHKFGNYVIKTLINKLYDGGVKYNEYLRMTINTIHLNICDLYSSSFYFYHDQNNYFDGNGNRYVQRSPYYHSKTLLQQCRNIKQKIDTQYKYNKYNNNQIQSFRN